MLAIISILFGAIAILLLIGIFLRCHCDILQKKLLVNSTTFAVFRLSPQELISIFAGSTAFLLSLCRASFFENSGFLSEFLICDSLSFIFVILTTSITLICIFASLGGDTKKEPGFYICFIFLEIILLLFFTTNNIIVFYICFELSLIPLFFLIGLYGGPSRVHAVYKFFLYTFFGSIVFLGSMIFLEARGLVGEGLEYNILLFPEFLVKTGLQNSKLLWIACFLAFAIKMPMWPFHTWLPYAHVEAPTSASMILAGVLLKMSGYGIIRTTLHWFPDLSYGFFAPYIYALSVIGVIYISLVALVQNDIKRLIAYSSVAHMATVSAGLFTGNLYGASGAIFAMISHGIVSAGLFFLVGALYDRMHTKEIAKLSGVANKAPAFAVVFLALSFASIGLPGTSGFIGEFLVILGLVQNQSFIAASGMSSGVILSAAYMLLLCKRVLFGSQNELTATLTDLSSREKVLGWMFVILSIYLGLQPSVVLDHFS